MTRVLVLGYFGFQNNQIDGQTIKTRSIFDLLCKKCDSTKSIHYFDTQQIKISPLRILALLKGIVVSKKIVYLPGYNNLNFFFPILYLVSKICKNEVYYVVVGGWLTEYIAVKKLHFEMLKRVKKIFPENRETVEILRSKFGFNNVSRLPNFREIPPLVDFVNHGPGLKVVFMARINKMKGIDTLFEVSDYFENDSRFKSKLSIDFFGPIHSEDYDYFFDNLKLHPNTKYCGVLIPESIYAVLSKYDVLILPTKYYTEGFPGSILDAYASGIPVIVSKWKFAEEFVEERKSGFIVPFSNNVSEINRCLEELLLNKNLLALMKNNAKKRSLEFSTENAWKILSEYFC